MYFIINHDTIVKINNAQKALARILMNVYMQCFKQTCVHS